MTGKTKFEQLKGKLESVENKMDIENFPYDTTILYVLSFDVCSLFTNVKVGRVLNYFL